MQRTCLTYRWPKIEGASELLSRRKMSDSRDRRRMLAISSSVGLYRDADAVSFFTAQPSSTVRN